MFQRVDHLCVPGRLRSGRMQSALFQAFVRNGASRLLS
ncbi:peptidase [Pseudomonas aeruginosa]|nr:peptidase [Pseudomonas aeruginosa]TEX74544.1 peptidase [Pseudomonas aeruginosa]